MLDWRSQRLFRHARVATNRMNLERAHTLLERAENHGISRDWGRLTQLQQRNKRGFTSTKAASMKAPHASIAWSDYETVPCARLCAWSEIPMGPQTGPRSFVGQRERPEEAMSILRELQRETEAAHHRYFLSG